MMLTAMQLTFWTAPGGPGGRTVVPIVPGASSRVTVGDVLTSRRTGRPYEAPGTGRPPALAEGRQRVSFDHVVSVDGAGAAECRFPDVAAHLRACGPCGEDFDGLLAAAAGAAS